MNAFRGISETVARRIDRLVLGIAGAGSLVDLEAAFLKVAGKVLPADCMCWNTWAPDWSRLLGCQSEAQYDAWFSANHELFNEYVGWHPVLAANPIRATALRVMRMSDYQSPREFKSKNPFYREVYRHLGFAFQVSYTAATLRSQNVILSWSREKSDFSDPESQVFRYLGDRLGEVCRRTEERQRLEESWKVLSDFVGAQWSTDSVVSLGERDVRVLADLLRGKTRAAIALKSGIRGDSVDKRLGAIRERLGLENHQQLLAALAELKLANVRAGLPRPR
jgi:DNA-binding CsgD family transcriptional regulator